MALGWQIVVGLLLGELVWAVYLLVAAVRVPRDKPAARFRSGWLGAFGLMLGLASGAGLGAVLTVFGDGSATGLVAAIALNAALQPVALLLCWTGVRKIALGVRGRVAYAWVQVPDSALADGPQVDQRPLSWLCVLQGMVVLPFGVGVSVAIASPLVLRFIA